jgi:hypothetical protein
MPGRSRGPVAFATPRLRTPVLQSKPTLRWSRSGRPNQADRLLIRREDRLADKREVPLAGEAGTLHHRRVHWRSAARRVRRDGPPLSGLA